MAKKYRCPYCNYSDERNELVYHISDNHEDMIPEGYTARRVVFNKVNHREYGTCMICKGRTEWDENIGKYKKICNKPQCSKAVRSNFEQRMLRVYSTTCLLNDEEHQEKMLAGRRISGEYKFDSGEKFTYTGSYEKKLLEFEEKILKISPSDIIMPGPVLEYEFNGETHKWITDQFIVPLNLIIEVKDGGKNPNTRQMPSYRKKQVAKETMITNLGTFNYLRLTDNQFDQLLGIMAEIKASMLDDSDDNKRSVIHINEMTSAATNAMPSPNNCYIVSYGYTKNTFSDDIEGFAVTPDILSDKLFVIDKGKIKKESFDFLTDRKFSIYKYTGYVELADLLCEDEVPDNYFYTKLTENGIITKDSLDFSSSVHSINLEYVQDNLQSIQSSIFHRFREAADEDQMYFSIPNPTIELAKKTLLNGNPDLDILKDVDGYFVLNKNLNQRTKSYTTLDSIPNPVVSIISDHDIIKKGGIL